MVKEKLNTCLVCGLTSSSNKLDNRWSLFKLCIKAGFRYLIKGKKDLYK